MARTQFISKKRAHLSVVQKRATERIDIRPSDGLSAVICLGDKNLEVRVYDISLSGLSIILGDDDKDALQCEKTYKIFIHRKWAKENHIEMDYKCLWIKDEDIGRRCGLQRKEEEKPFREIFSETEVLTVNDKVPIVAYLYQDIFYNEKIAIKLKMLSQTKIVFELFQTTEAFIFPGMSAMLNLTIVNNTKKPLEGMVADIRRNGEKFEVLLNIKKLTKDLEKDLVAHLLYNDTHTPHQLRKVGLKAKIISNHFRIRFINCEKDIMEYNKVLELRKKAYVSVHKLDKDIDPRELIAPLDHISRILAAYHGSKIIATVALSFPKSEITILDVERALGKIYPQDLPRKMNLMEVSRLCIDDEYRRSDLLIRIFEHIYRVFLASDRDYVITSADDQLWPTYKRIGFRKTPHSYGHLIFNGIKHHIILIDKAVCISAKGLNPITWNVIYRDMNMFMSERINIQINFIQKFKVKCMRMLGTVLRI